MSDFQISFRPLHKNDALKAGALMQYHSLTKIKYFYYQNASIVTSRADDFAIWGPYENKEKGITIALNGRITLNIENLSQIKTESDDGGIACKYIYLKYIEYGEKCIEFLNGNFTVYIYDRFKNLLIVGTDRCGTVPCFMLNIRDQLIIGSHPDIINASSGNNSELDLVSCSEFLSTGKISPPHTYYKTIKYLGNGSIYKIFGNATSGLKIEHYKYFEFLYSFDHGIKESRLVEELAAAFKNAVNRRASPMFGKTGISLSAGLDSRTVLCSIADKENVVAFSFFDKENNEYSIAKKIALTAGVPLIPMRRKFEHYGENAIKGICIAGGMGDFGNNHYLGFIEKLNEYGISNILTGFYCDYFFKGLSFNKKENKITRRNSFAPFEYSWYMPVFWFNSIYTSEVQGRLEVLFPNHITDKEDNSSRSVIENHRVFPLCYEPDNFESIVPQRTMGWFLPVVDNDIVDIYLKIPPELKINIDFFSKVTAQICGNNISKIVNGNTGARVGAGMIEIMVLSNFQAIKRKIKLIQNSMSTFDSWPNWSHYIKKSSTISNLWDNCSNDVKDILCEITGENYFQWSLNDFVEKRRISFFRRILTMKIWLEERFR